MSKIANRSTFKALIVFIISAIIITGCSNNGNGNGEETKVFTSEDGQVQLTLDKVWIEDPDLISQAILGVSERKNEKYAMVNTVAKSDMTDSATLDDFKTTFINNIQYSLTNAEVSNNKIISVDSTEAQLFEITGEADKVKVHYLVALLEKDDSFYQIVTWSTASKFESHKQELLKLIESFKVLKVTPATTATPSESTDVKEDDDQNTETSTLTSDDKKMEITVPAYMTFELELSPIADIQASNMLEEVYMMVMREGKDLFADDYTLTDFYNAISDSMSDSVMNGTKTEPQEIQVNGQPAVQFEFSGEIDKIKISYLITLVETDGNFTQLLFWTLQNRMDENLDMFINASSTFKEVK